MENQSYLGKMRSDMFADFFWCDNYYENDVHKQVCSGFVCGGGSGGVKW